MGTGTGSLSVVSTLYKGGKALQVKLAYCDLRSISHGYAVKYFMWAHLDPCARHREARVYIYKSKVTTHIRKQSARKLCSDTRAAPDENPDTSHTRDPSLTRPPNANSNAPLEQIHPDNEVRAWSQGEVSSGRRLDLPTLEPAAHVPRTCLL